MTATLLLGAAPLATVPIARETLPWWHARHDEKLAEAHARPIEVVFLGDSITQQWENHGPPPWRDYQPVWNRFYGDRAALNLGFNGDATSHLLWRLQHGEVDGLRPKAAIILIGANNLGRLHWPAEADIAGIEAVVAETRRRLPQTQILLLGVLPSDRGDWVRETTSSINHALAGRYAAGQVPLVHFLDLSSLFLLPNGDVDTTQFRDPQQTPPSPALHPSAQAAQRMAVAIEPTLARILGDHPHGP